MKYFFVLGTNPTLSIAELEATVGLKKSALLAADLLVAELETEINPENLIKTLGGTIKIGVIQEEIIAKDSRSANNELIAAVIKMATFRQKKSPSGKFNFGFSTYGQGDFNKKDLGIKLKNYFSEHDLSSRFVVSREKTLSSVVIAQNKLLTRGIEIIIVRHEDKILIGETISVQPFKDLGLRDFGRPARDDLSGMIPPKLALTMINLAGLENRDAIIIDPFCGSGTILNEAALLGYKNLFGADISPRATSDTYKNFSWLKELYKLENVRLKLMVKNVLNLSKFIKADYADAIITEPFLGPQRGMINFKTVISNLEELYTGAISEFRKVLKSGGRVIMVWPSFYGQKPISPSYTGFKIINPLPKSLENNSLLKKTGRDTIIYSRPGQKVFREIVILKKI
jgi:tRNA G10  N-methylase Trm11